MVAYACGWGWGWQRFAACIPPAPPCAPVLTAPLLLFSPPCPQVGGQRRFVDISVPRNIAHSINELPGAIVYNVDDLKVG